MCVFLLWVLVLWCMFGTFSSFSYHLDERERAGCFTSICCGCLRFMTLQTIPWLGLQSVVVVFPDPEVIKLE